MSTHADGSPPIALVLDANQRAALAVTRSLGSRGAMVHCADSTPRSLAGASRWSAASLQAPSAEADPKAFTAWVHETTRKIGADIVFAVTEVSSRTLLETAEPDLRERLPFAPLHVVDALADKGRLIESARKLGIPCPASLRVECAKDFDPEALAFPVVLKPTRSHVRIDGRWQPTAVRIVHDPEQLAALLAHDSILAEHPCLVQEYVPGRGAGVFALYDRGAPVTFFAHRRLREKPPRGGVSVLSESVPLEPSMREYAERLLSESGWHGVAMVEFRITAQGDPYLMEVNARFWGSLQLAVDCGVDFPWLLWEVSAGRRPAAPAPYAHGKRLRWLLGDLDSLYLTLRNDLAYDWIEKFRAIIRFSTPRPDCTRHEVDRWNDLGPASYELRQYVRQLLSL